MEKEKENQEENKLQKLLDDFRADMRRAAATIFREARRDYSPMGSNWINDAAARVVDETFDGLLKVARTQARDEYVREQKAEKEWGERQVKEASETREAGRATEQGVGEAKEG